VGAHTRWGKVGPRRSERELRKERKRNEIGEGLDKGKRPCLSYASSLSLSSSWVTLGLLLSVIQQIFIMSTMSRCLAALVTPMNKTGKDPWPHIFYSRRCRQAIIDNIINKAIRQLFK